MSKFGKRLLKSLRQAAAYAQGERGNGERVTEFTVENKGDREIITKRVNGVIDPVPSIKRKV